MMNSTIAHVITLINHKIVASDVDRASAGNYFITMNVQTIGSAAVIGNGHSDCCQTGLIGNDGRCIGNGATGNVGFGCHIGNSRSNGIVYIDNQSIGCKTSVSIFYFYMNLISGIALRSIEQQRSGQAVGCNESCPTPINNKRSQTGGNLRGNILSANIGTKNSGNWVYEHYGSGVIAINGNL